MSNRIVVVGDHFAKFANHPSVMTLTEFRSGKRALTGERLLIGQGMSHIEVQQFGILQSRDDHAATIERRDDLATLELTHKRDVRNVLITLPRKTDHATYVVELALNDEMDRLIDHVTGAHIGGIVLLEAGRQATIATGEIEYQLASRPEPWGFVWTGCQVRFSQFVFPVPTQIRVTIVEDADSTATRPKCTAKISFEQASKTIAELAINYELLPQRTLETLESRAAKRLIQSLCHPSVSVSPPPERNPQSVSAHVET